jgi:hypothetical protein
MPTLGAALNFAKLEALNLRAHNLSTAPSSPVTGQLYYDTLLTALYYWNGSSWIAAGAGAGPADATTSSKGIVQLAGDLAGTAASPQIAAGVITDADVNGANKDGAVGTASLRTLGAGAQQAMPGNRTLDAITAPAADLNLNTHKIIGVLDPTGAQDAATKNYVDTFAQGLDSHPSVKAASTANLTLSGTQTVDGIALVAGDRILAKDQTTTSANGIYVVAAGAWARALDQDTWAEVPSAYVWVEQGTVNADSGWVCTSDQGGTLNTTAITWVQFTAAGAAIAGAGLTKTGNTIDAVGTANRILVNADNIDIHGSYVGQASITTLGTVTSGVWNGSAVPVANGGTGQTSAKAARETGLLDAGYYSTATHGAGTTITITAATHGLRATRGLIVQVQLEADGSLLIPDVAVAANGDVTVTFAVSQSANTIRVTVLG